MVREGSYVLHVYEGSTVYFLGLDNGKVQGG